MAGRTTGREHRVADFIQRALSVLIRQEMRDPRVGMVTINEVRVSRDYSYADIYVSELGGGREHAGELIATLQGASGYLRSLIAKQSTMRITPKLRFHYDEALEEGLRMDKVIRDAVQSDQRADQRTHQQKPGTSDGT